MDYNIKELEIIPKMYEKAKEFENMSGNMSHCEDTKERKLLLDKLCVLDAKFEREFCDTFSIFNIVKEYERREKNANKQLNELHEQDKNIYRITFTNGKILEIKVKCVGCVYNEEINQVLTIDYNLKYSVLENDVFSGVKTIECIERNNNLDLSKDKQWWLKLSIDI